MCFTRFKFALIWLSAMCLTSCWSSRKAVSLTQTSQRHEVSDTLREQVIVAVFDTITITIRENENGDTLRMTTVTDRERVRDRSQLKVKSEKLKVETDTVYVEKDSLRLTAYSLPGTEIEKDGNVTKKVNRFAQSLRWLFLTLVAVIILIIIIKLKIIK